MENKEKIFVGAREAADMMNVSMPTFYELAALEGFPAFRVGKKILVSVEGIKEWAKARYGSSVC